ncbi:MAG: M23 family metallopeptidase [Casimicrobiaceae bacterium]
MNNHPQFSSQSRFAAMLVGVLVAIPLCALAATKTTNAAAAVAQKKSDAPMVVAPGSVFRWSAPGTKRCAMGGRSWSPIGETCYFPVDLLQKPGVLTVTRSSTGRPESAKVTIEAFDYGTEEVNLPDIPQRDPAAADLKRVAREGALLSKVWRHKESPAQFALPLGPVVKPMPPGKAFGVSRIFNGKPASQPHMGTDYAAGPGVPVLAVADGTVAIAQDLFYPGGAVIINHGDGLVTEAFHLSEMSVAPGAQVKKGQVVGKVGTTGRSTGPHLFFGVRWHNARINPKWLLEDPAKMPAIHK